MISVERDGPDRGKEYEPAITCRGVDPALFSRSERPIGEHQPRIRLQGAQRELQLRRHQTSPVAIDTATASLFCCSVYSTIADGSQYQFWMDADSGTMRSRAFGCLKTTSLALPSDPRSKARHTARGQVGHERGGIHALSCCISFIYYKYYYESNQSLLVTPVTVPRQSSNILAI
jgi:hypothetical protein